MVTKTDNSLQKENSIVRPVSSYFPDIYFNEKYHTYTYNNKNFPSVSKKVKDFYVPFDRSQARWSAKKNNISTKEMLRQWDEARDESIILGNRVHAFAEHYLSSKYSIVSKVRPTCNKELGVVQFMMDLDPKYEIAAVELILYNLELKYAGTTDFILRNKETGKYVICDWKTNKDIHKNHKKQKMLHPFTNMLDCPLSHYKVQLNLYQMAVQSMGLEVEGRMVIWLTQDGDKYYKLYEIADHSSKLKSFYKSK